MVKKKFWKDTFKSIKSNIGRFLAMFSIVLLSSGVITGLLVTSPNIKKTMQEQYYKKDVADINVFFPNIKFPIELGFSDKEVELIKTDFDHILPYKLSFDYLNVETKEDNERANLNLAGHIYEFKEELNNLPINKLELIEGNFPQDENEVLIERETYRIKDLNVGDLIHDGSNTYKISGIVKNIWYFSKEAERDLETGNELEIIIYKQNKDLDLYNNIFITLDKREDYDLFGKKYNNLLKDETSYIKDSVIPLVENSIKDELKSKIPMFANQIDSMNNFILVLDRNTNISFASFKSLISKIETITNLFPIFFLVVSILVVLTTMTRMIEEERQKVGILRSLGYPKRTIYFKYIFYGLLVGVIGSGLGYAFGFRLIPEIVRSALGTIYFMEPLNLDIYSTSNLIYIIFIVLSIIVTSIFAVKKTLKETTANMLIARSPKLGMRILLERIPFIWNRLKFKYKSSLRNLFRYPKHFLMTVIGVMGSLALVFTGIGLTSSVDALTKVQYDQLHKYDLKVHLKKHDLELIDKINNNYTNSLDVKYFTDILTVKKTDEDFYINIIVADEPNEYYKLINRKSREELTLDDNGVIVTEQIASYLELKIDQKIKIKDQELVIKGITENYIENYIYMTNNYFTQVFDETIDLNYQVLIKDKNMDKDVVTNDLEDELNVRSLEFVNEEVLSKKRQLDQVTLLAIVIVIAAVFLQVVIIYNLTNVNISEREKELSTLKVLGYRNIEVSTYIYREINIMTVIGMILGVPFGFLLLRFIVVKIDSPNLMMGRNVGWYTYLSSILLAIIMTILVEIVMHFKIKKIDMISALKEL